MSRLPSIDFKMMEKFSSVSVLWLSVKKAAMFFIVTQMGGQLRCPIMVDAIWRAL